MNTAPVQLHVALRGLDAEGKRVLAVPQQTTGSHAFGTLRGHPQLVLTLDGLPWGERVMRIRQSTIAGSYHLLLDDLSPSWPRACQPSTRLLKKRSPLRSNTVPHPATKRHFDGANLTPVDSDFIISWAATEPLPALSPTGFSSHPSSLTEGSQNVGEIDSDRFTGTPSSSTDSDFSVAASDFQHLQHVTPTLTATGSLGSDVDELADLELARFACEFPQLGVSFKRRSEEPEVVRPTKRLRPSPAPETAQADNVSDSTDLEADSDDDSEDESEEADSEDGSEDESDNDDDAFITDTSNQPRMRTPQTGFPCPLSLHHPQGRLCSHRNMKSTRSVEKHLFSWHRRPPFCPVCRTTFGTYAACDTHIISRTCKKTESLPVVEGLTETQTRDVSLCLDSRLSRAEQYRAMWEVVHPGVELPARVGDRRRMLAVRALEEHWMKSGRKTIRDFFGVKRPQVDIGCRTLAEVQAVVLDLMTQRLHVRETFGEDP